MAGGGGEEGNLRPQGAHKPASCPLFLWPFDGGVAAPGARVELLPAQAGLTSPVTVPGFLNGLYLWLVFILVCFYEDPVCHSSALLTSTGTRPGHCSIPSIFLAQGPRAGVLSKCLLTDESTNFVLAHSRAILQEVLDADLSNEAFPFSTHKLVRAAGHLVGTTWLLSPELWAAAVCLGLRRGSRSKPLLPAVRWGPDIPAHKLFGAQRGDGSKPDPRPPPGGSAQCLAPAGGLTPRLLPGNTASALPPTRLPLLGGTGHGLSGQGGVSSLCHVRNDRAGDNTALPEETPVLPQCRPTPARPALWCGGGGEQLSRHGGRNPCPSPQRAQVLGPKALEWWVMSGSLGPGSGWKLPRRPGARLGSARGQPVASLHILVGSSVAGFRSDTPRHTRARIVSPTTGSFHDRVSQPHHCGSLGRSSTLEAVPGAVRCPARAWPPLIQCQEHPRL